MSLDASVTLEDVFVVVNAKRVPLAPELAGYLALEIAEGADATAGDVDPKFVFIGEEGTVGVVRPKRDGATGDAELSIRAILARLLEASGSQTPALSLASKRRGTGGLSALVEELEAALIPVNRAAGRRALARLAREVKRVTLGVGRNASAAAAALPRGSSPSHAALAPMPREREPEPPTPAPPSAAPPSSASRSADIPAEAPTRRTQRDAAATFGPEESTSTHLSSIPPAPVHDASDLPTVTFTPNAPRSQADSVDNLIAQFDVPRQQSDANIGRDLKAMIGLDPTAPPPGVSEGPRPSQVEIDALMASGAEAPPSPSRREPPLKRETPAPPRAVSARTGESSLPVMVPEPRVSERQLPTGPSQLRRSRASLPNIRKPRSSTMILVILGLIAVSVGVVVMWRFKPGFLSGRTQEKVDQERAAYDAEQKQRALDQQALNCRATLVVTDAPPNAEVLEFVGQAPVDVDQMPVGTRLEFVATAEGYAPKRTVVPAGATWDSGPDKKPRFEVAVQLDKSRVKPGSSALDLWPPTEPGTIIGGDGPPGTVHLVSTPKGSEVWHLVGVGPTAELEQIKCATDVDVLVAGPTTRRRLHVAAADFSSQQTDPKSGATIKTAHVSAK